MADADLRSLLQTLDQIPQPLQQIRSLHEIVDHLLEILKDFPRKSSLSISHLEEKIRDASREAKDIVDSHKPGEVVPKSTCCGAISSCFWEMIASMIPSINLPEESFEFRGLDKLIMDFVSVLEDLSKMKEEDVEDPRPRSSSTSSPSRIDEKSTLVGREEEAEDPRPRSSSTSRPSRIDEKSTLVGRDDDLLQIKGQLTGWLSKLNIITILGMGGIGKTTLARNLYNDSLIEHHFDIRAWVVVSQDYHLQQIFCGLLDCTGDLDGELHQKSIEQLADVLYKKLKCRRYLIVLDDVWDPRVWDGVKRFFPDDKNGSRVIVTTRLSEVATHASSYSSVHRMGLLSPETSWNLLREKVFGKECCPFASEEIGKKIAQNCKGLPLAIIVVSGLLSRESRTQDWEDIARNINSIVTRNYDQIIGVLSLSYSSLPHHLKACFLYMGTFPEDYVMSASRLIKLWIAEGFVETSPDKSLENVAEGYLEDLIGRSLVMVHKRNHNGRIKACIIHDMLRELCVKKAREEKLFQIMNSDVGTFSHSRKNQRRVSIHSNNIARSYIDDLSVRSVLWFLGHRSNDLFISLTLSCRLLRVLDALKIRFHEFPNEIVQLECLRYLSFSCGDSIVFPASISKLRSLETLIVYQVKLLKSIIGYNNLYLPSTIWGMPQFRHLLLGKSFLPTYVGEDSVVVLRNLQTLSGVRDFKCTRKVLEMMPNLKKLGISYYNANDTVWSSYEFDNFVYLHRLETLECFFSHKFPLSVKFAFPRSLKKLTLSGCGISWTEMTVVGSLPNLEVLKLKDNAFTGEEWEPNEGEFRELKFLLMQKIPLKRWMANETHFPRLEHLSLSLCSDLEEIPRDIGEIPTLEMLELYECSPLAVASAKQIKEEQRELENNSLTVRAYSFWGKPLL